MKDIFVRWISCDNEVLNHVTSQTLAILFSHEYLTPDEFLDLAELLLGVHEGFGAFSNVGVTQRKSRNVGIIFGSINESSSDDDDIINDKYMDNDSQNNDIIQTLNEHTHNNKFNLSVKTSTTTTPKQQTKKMFANTDTLPTALSPNLIGGAGSNYSMTESSGSMSINESDSTDSDSGNNGIEQLPFDIHWDNRLYSAMNVLTLIVQNDKVSDRCIISLDEWIGLIVMDIFKRSHNAGFGVLESFIRLLKATLFRFASKPDIMGESKVAQFMCQEPESLLDIITGNISTLVTRSIALELCPLLMVTSNLSEQFAHKCLITVLDDGRFNPFEPGDIQMSRTFQRSAHDGKLRTIDHRNPLKRLQTVAAYVPTLLFQNQNKVFVDEESVMRLTFMTVIKAINTLSRKIISLDDIKDDSKNNNDDTRLEGEFDSSTARKIRNFFSRDSEYTRNRILELIGEEDDVLIDVLLELLLIETSLKKSKSRLAQRIRYLFDPMLLFHDFIIITQADHSLLLDFLISNETSFLDYLLRFCKRMTANWHPSRANGNQVQSVMSILIRLRMTIRNLHNKKLFPYSPKSLLKAMEKMEFCYETNNGAYSQDSLAAWNDPHYIEKRKKQRKERKQRERELIKKQEQLKKKKTKKIKINKLFIQDVEQQKIDQQRKMEIKRKTELNLLKREKRKSLKKRKLNNNDDLKIDNELINDTTNYNKIKRKKKHKKKHKKSKKQHHSSKKNKSKPNELLSRKHKKGATNQFLISNVKSTQHKQKLRISEQTLNIANQFATRKASKKYNAVDATKKVRIGF